MILPRDQEPIRAQHQSEVPFCAEDEVGYEEVGVCVAYDAECEACGLGGETDCDVEEDDGVAGAEFESVGGVTGEEHGEEDEV